MDATGPGFRSYKSVMHSITLAQMLTESPVPRLPDPPAAAYYMLESPWVVIAGILLLGVLSLVTLRRTGRARLGVMAMAVGAVLAAAVGTVAWLVTTEREVLRERTRGLIDAAARADTGAVGPMLTERVRLGPFSPVIAEMSGRETLLEGVRKYMGGEFPIVSHRLGPVQAVLDGPSVARTQVRVWVEPREKMYGTDPGSWWRIEWRREPGQAGESTYGPWRVTDLTIMQLDGLGVNPQGGRSMRP